MDLNNISNEIIEQNQALIQSYLAESNIDASPGTVVGEMIVKPGSILYSAAESAFQDTLNNLDLSTAEDPYAQLILSNYGLSVQSAGQGVGYVMILTESDEDLTIRSATIFTAGTYGLFIERDYIGTVDYSSEMETIYVPLKKYDDTRYYMLIEAFTIEAMETPLLPGTAVTPSDSITGFSSAEVATSFEVTSQSRTVEDLKEEVSNGVAAKILGGPAHIKATLEESKDLAVIDSSVTGMNDAEMLRDNKNIYGTSSGGYVDIYVKTSPYASIIEVEKTGVKISDGRYKVLINKDDAPGFYYIKSVSYNDITRTSDIGLFDYTFGADLSDAPIRPVFPEDRHARFSAFQNCSVEFDYTGVPSEDTEPVFTFELVYMPTLLNVQNFISDDDIRTPAADYVTKAVVPMFLSAELNISYNPADSIPDEDTVKEVITNAVNKIPMGQRFLSGAEIACAVQSVYSDSVVKLPIILEAFTIDNNGNFWNKRSTDTLEIPYLPDRGISSKTATFMINPSDISISLTGDKK